MQAVLLKDLPEYLRFVVEQPTMGSKTVCPKCDGGRSGELSLSVNEGEDGIVWLRCWRASCGWRSLTLTDPTATVERRPMKKVTVYREPIEPLAYGDLNLRLRKRYGIDMVYAQGHGWGASPDGKTLIMPVRCPYGGVRGHVTRTFTDPKRCYTYKATAQPWLDWWGRVGSPLIVVEDTISACRLAGLGYRTVALLGTSISNPQAKEIATAADRCPVYLALDRDAFVKSLDHAKRHAHIVQFLPVCLTEDIKNMKDDDDIHKLFKRVI
jgi:hypothetical protein